MLDIGDVVHISGLPPSTLRFYEEKGLIHSIGRTGLRRLYDHRVLERLEFIAMGQIAGFGLEEISAMFAKDGRLKVDRNLLLEKSSELERSIKQLGAIRNTLEHVAHCSAPDHLECPKFLRLLKLAGKKQSKHRKTPIKKRASSAADK
ncbi:MAG: helix-turn-helix domain-containing protein [Bdellovibrionales bacterium]|nr:helix-turn-helix domain-containing protein [Bdellovibrionales bacterium]